MLFVVVVVVFLTRMDTNALTCMLLVEFIHTFGGGPDECGRKSGVDG